MDYVSVTSVVLKAYEKNEVPSGILYAFDIKWCYGDRWIVL